MWSAKSLEVLALALLLFSQGAGMLVVPVHALGSPGSPALAAWAPAPGDRGSSRVLDGPRSGCAASRAAADAPTSIGERRARAVAMTVFSLGAVIAAGFLVGFLIKRLL